MPMYNNQRDEIADMLMQQQNKGGALGYGMTGLSNAMPPSMPSQMPAGMPQTPMGGVPGSGMAPAGPSTVQLPPQQLGTMGPMPGMGSLGGAQPQVGGVPSGLPGAMPDIGMQGMRRQRGY